MAVKIERCPHLRGDILHLHILTIQFPIFEFKIVHYFSFRLIDFLDSTEVFGFINLFMIFVVKS